jgi:hypothetical protein
MGCFFSLDKEKKKKKKSEKKNSRWPPQKNLIFQLRQSSIFFHGLVLGLVELIDMKGIGMAQPWYDHKN